MAMTKRSHSSINSGIKINIHLAKFAFIHKLVESHLSPNFHVWLIFTRSENRRKLKNETQMRLIKFAFIL